MATKTKKATTKSKAKAKAKSGANAKGKAKSAIGAKAKVSPKAKGIMDKMSMGKAKGKMTSGRPHKIKAVSRGSSSTSSHSASVKSTGKASSSRTSPENKMPRKQGRQITTTAVSFGSLITPLDDRLVVSVDEREKKTSGGILIPDTSVDRPNRGEVVAKGPGRRNKKGQLRPLDVNVGDRVMFGEYAGTKLLLEGNELLILREDEVLGVVTA